MDDPLVDTVVVRTTTADAAIRSYAQAHRQLWRRITGLGLVGALGIGFWITPHGGLGVRVWIGIAVAFVITAFLVLQRRRTVRQERKELRSALDELVDACRQASDALDGDDGDRVGAEDRPYLQAVLDEAREVFGRQGVFSAAELGFPEPAPAS